MARLMRVSVVAPPSSVLNCVLLKQRWGDMNIAMMFSVVSLQRTGCPSTCTVLAAMSRSMRFPPQVMVPDLNSGSGAGLRAEAMTDSARV